MMKAPYAVLVVVTLVATLPFSVCADPIANEMVMVPAGTFVMGDGHPAHECSRQERQVTLTRDFYLGQHPVTNQEYLDLLQWAYDNGHVTATSASVNDNLDGSTQQLVELSGEFSEIQFNGGTFALKNAGHGINPQHPVKEVNWFGAARYCDWLSLRAGRPRAYAHNGDWACNGGDPYGAEGFRLPTDAEFEYAAQFDDERDYPWGNEPPDCSRVNYTDCVGWTSAVGSYPDAPQALGLSDMAGNVYERCNDWFECELGTSPLIDPTGPATGTHRVIRGGSWLCPYATHLRSAFRDEYHPGNTYGHCGFRIASTVPPPVPPQVSGIVTASESGDPIAGASVTIHPQHSGGATTTGDDGRWEMQVVAGAGYILEVAASQMMSYRQEGLIFEEGMSYVLDVALDSLSYENYRIVEVAAAPNPPVLEIPEGGFGYAWFVLEGEVEEAWLPVPFAEVAGTDQTNDPYSCVTSSLLYQFLLTPFNLQGVGLFGIPVPANTILTGQPGSQETVTLTHIDGVELPDTSQVSFEARVVPASYVSEWGYRIYGKIGVGGTAGVATVTGFAGGGSGATIGITTSGYGQNPPLEGFAVQRANDLFLQQQVQVGPPRLIDVGGAATAQITLSFPYGEEYVFDMTQLAGLEAATAFYLFVEPVLLFGPPTSHMTASFLSWLVELLIENPGSTGFGVARVADQVGLDIEGAISAGASLGIGGLEELGLQMGASLGAKAHLGGMMRVGVNEEVEKQLYLTAGYAGSIGPKFVGAGDGIKASLMIPLNFAGTPALPPELEVGYNIAGKWVADDWRETRFTVSLRSTDDLLDGYSLPGSRQKYSFFVTVDQQAVNNLLHNTTQLPNQALEIGSALVDIAVDNESFKTDLVHFLRAVYDQQQGSNPVVLPYGFDAAGISEISFDLEIEFPLPLFPALDLAIGRGISASAVHKYQIARGQFASGLPLLRTELPSPPTNNLGFLDMILELWSQVTSGDVLQELADVILSHLYHTFFDWDRDQRSLFVISPHGSSIDIGANAVPAGTDSVFCRYWEWGDGTLMDNRGAGEKKRQLREYISYLRRVREEILGMRYGIGGFYALEPRPTQLLETAQLTIRYLDTEVEELDEALLSIFYEDDSGTWQPVPSMANPDSNWVQAEIDILRTYTIGPRMPQGEYGFSCSVDSLVADGVSTALLTSDYLFNNDGTSVVDGTLFTLTATHGTILNEDADPQIDGIQTQVSAGVVQVQYQTGLLPIDVDVAAQSVTGFARCAATLQLLDAGAPAAPVITDLRPLEGGFVVNWEGGGEEDLAGFFVWYDTDEPGPPYEGQASIWGQDSPIELGMLDSMRVDELESGLLYYVAITAFDTGGHHSPYSEELTIVADVGQHDAAPARIHVSQNAPNPFAPWTKIKYALPHAAHVRIIVYDVEGRRVDVLVDKPQDAGQWEVVWDGRNDRGESLPSGLYFYRVELGAEVRTRRMLIVR